ncbi:DUF4349 domain-containing protein [Lysinibacter cavernae]|uniref:DUF4349 domain-containing protein n=1 Tax=Lysinibacter cavernae TaxID=1640652 RepID=A0A7X5QZV7_9MICO|nr:DUF4349 domain-containing protein [Lysinibacter cavernae]NIH53058.1 hypothetical protein [Lysinibacter cavernae]
MKRPLLSGLAAVASVLLLAGCSAGNSTAPLPAIDKGGDYQSLPQQMDGAPDEASSGFDAQSPTSETSREIIRTGDVTLSADDPIALGDDVVELIASADGRIDSRSDTPSSEYQTESVWLSVRIPNISFDKVTDQIAKLGTLISSSFSAQDVTQQANNLDARIDALQTSVDRLTELLAQSANTADLIAAETALSERQAELDGLISDREFLSDQVEYSTLSVNIQSTETVVQTEPQTFWDGIVAGWNSILAFGAGLIVVVGVLVPWIVLLGVVVVVIWLIVRGRRSRKSAALKRAKDAHSSGTSAT